jgi:hypothetical protein
MFPRFVVTVVLAAGLLAIPGGVPGQAQNPGGEPARKPVGVTPDPSLRKIVSILHTQRITFEGDLTQTSLSELLGIMAKKYEINFVVRNEAFREAGEANIADKKPHLWIARLDGLPLHQFLTLVLTSMGAVPMVRNDYIEILPREAVLKEVGLVEAINEATLAGDPEAVNRAQARLALPLVNVVVEDKPLPAVLAEVARVYDLNIVIDARLQKDIRGVVLTERLLNVPADTALELLAGQAGLTVTRKGNTFRVSAGGVQ